MGGVGEVCAIWFKNDFLMTRRYGFNTLFRSNENALLLYMEQKKMRFA